MDSEAAKEEVLVSQASRAGRRESHIVRVSGVRLTRPPGPLLREPHFRNDSTPPSTPPTFENGRLTIQDELNFDPALTALILTGRMACVRLFYAGHTNAIPTSHVESIEDDTAPAAEKHQVGHARSRRGTSGRVLTVGGVVLQMSRSMVQICRRYVTSLHSRYATTRRHDEL